MAFENRALLVRGASATQDGYWNERPGNNTIDGNDLLYWQSPGGGVANHWVRIDLGLAYEIEQIRFLGDAQAFYSATSYRIAYSQNDTDWFTLEDHAVGQQDETFAITPTSARYWRFTALAGGIGEWLVYTIELWAESGVFDPPGGDPLYILDFLYNNFYQDVLDWFEAKDPGWTFTVAEAMTMTGIVFAIDLLQALYGSGGGSGVTLAQLQAETAETEAVVNGRHDALDTLLAAYFANVTTEHEHIETEISVTEGNLDASIVTETGQIDSAIAALDPASTADVNAARDYLDGQINTCQAAVIGALEADIDEAVGVINVNTDGEVQGARDVITSTIGSALATIVAAIGGIETQLANGVSQILSAIAALRFPKTYSGSTGRTLGTPQAITGTGTVLASVNGVGGTMDGVLFSLTFVPSTKGYQDAGSLRNWKYLGWIVFCADDGMADELQFVGPEDRAYLPKQLTSPASVVIFLRDASQATVTPFVVD